MAFCPGKSEIGKWLCTLFGVPPNKVRRITLDFEAQSVATVTIEMYVDENEAAALLDDLEQVGVPTSLIVPVTSEEQASFTGFVNHARGEKN